MLHDDEYDHEVDVLTGGHCESARELERLFSWLVLQEDETKPCLTDDEWGFELGRKFHEMMGGGPSFLMDWLDVEGEPAGYLTIICGKGWTLSGIPTEDKDRSADGLLYRYFRLLAAQSLKSLPPAKLLELWDEVEARAV